MDIEEIKKKKLLELMRRAHQQNNLQDLTQERDIISLVNKYLMLIRENLDEKAYERLMNVRIVNPELYARAVFLLFQMKSAGRLKGTIDDSKMKKFLMSLLPKERETKIIRK